MAFVGVIAYAANVFSQTSAFTYQGQLKINGSPANGSFDIRFDLFASESGGSALTAPQTNPLVQTNNGVFTVTLDFGPNVFDGSNRWIELGVRPAGDSGNYTTLAPRLPVTSTPFAIRALTAGSVTNPIPDAQLSGNIPRLDGNNTFTNSLNVGAITVNGTSIINASGEWVGSPTGLQGPPGPAGAEGPKGLNWRGTYSSGTSYAISDAVFYNGSAWFALQANTNITPVAGTRWSLLAQQGATGSTGATGAQGVAGPKGLNWRGVYASSTAYVVDDAVQYNGSSWVALQANTNVTPVAGTRWSLLAQQGATGPQGPAGPAVSTSAACGKGVCNFSSDPGCCNNVCGGASKVVARNEGTGDCYVTSDTGPCGLSNNPFTGFCCVCKP